MKYLFVLAALVGSASAQCNIPPFGTGVQGAATDGCSAGTGTLQDDSSCNIECVDGYTGTGAGQYTCGTGALTTTADLTCAANPCASAFTTANIGVAGGAGTASGSTFTFGCANGYAASGVATCTLGAWDSPTCDAVPCPSLVVANSDATTEITGKTTGMTQVVTCNSGYWGSATPATCTAGTGATASWTGVPYCADWYVCGTAEKEVGAPSATANRVCGWKTCADVNADSRVRGADGNADADTANTAVTVNSSPVSDPSNPSCLCGADQEGVMSVLPDTMDMAPAPAECVDLAAGVVEHEMKVTVAVNAALADYETSQTTLNAGFATKLWLLSGLEAAHVKFEGAAAHADNTLTDVTFKLVFASKTWAETAQFAIWEADAEIVYRHWANAPAHWAAGDITEVVLDGAAHSGVGVLAAAVVATALLL